jgi:hypothetical protein
MEVSGQNHAPDALIPVKEPRYPLDRMPHSRSGRCWVRQIFCLCRDFNPGRPARRYIDWAFLTPKLFKSSLNTPKINRIHLCQRPKTLLNIYISVCNTSLTFVWIILRGHADMLTSHLATRPALHVFRIPFTVAAAGQMLVSVPPLLE